MNYKKIMLSVLASGVICQTVMPMDNDGAAYKEAVRGAAYRAFGGWAKARVLPGVAGVVAGAIPPVLLAFGFMAGIGAGKTPKVVECAIAIGYLSYISVPAAVGLLARQGFLTARDLNLLHKFTHSTARFNIQNLPEIAQIQQMDNHHQLLNVVRRHTNAEGNSLERWLIDTRGFRGYKTDEATHS